jgi:hypothetical protein
MTGARTLASTSTTISCQLQAAELARFEAFRCNGHGEPLSRSVALRRLVARALDLEFAAEALPESESGISPGEAETRWFAERFPAGAAPAEMTVLNEAFARALDQGLQRGSRGYFEFLESALGAV